MAVEILYGSLARAAFQNNPPTTPVPGYMDAGVNFAGDKIAYSASANVGSQGFFARLPSHAIILPQSHIWFSAGGGAATLDVGDVNDPDGLATAISVASAGSSELLEAKAAGAKLARLWEHLGYSEDPGGVLDLYHSIKAATASALTVETSVLWTV